MNLREQREAQLAEIEARLEAATWVAMRSWLDDAATATLRDGLIAAAGDVPDPGAISGAESVWQRLVNTHIVTAIGEVLGELFAATLSAAGVISARPWQEKYLAEVPNRLKNIPDRAFEVVRDEVQGAIDDGQSIADMRDRVATVLSSQQGGSENAWKKRATLIARTEASGAYNGGQVAAWAYRDSITGDATDKVWLATMDPRCRASHFAADGQRVPLDGEFIVGGARLAHPGDHRAPVRETANCRCTVVEVPRGEDLPEVGDRQLSGGSARAEVRRRREAGETRDPRWGLTATAQPPSAAPAAGVTSTEENPVSRSTIRPGLTAAGVRKFTEKRDGDGDGLLDEASKVTAGAARVKSTKAERASTPVAGTGSPALPDATDEELFEEHEGRLSRNNLYQDPATRTEAEHLADELEDRGHQEKADSLRNQIDDHLAGGDDEDEDWEEEQEVAGGLNPTAQGALDAIFAGEPGTSPAIKDISDEDLIAASEEYIATGPELGSDRNKALWTLSEEMKARGLDDEYQNIRDIAMGRKPMGRPTTEPASDVDNTAGDDGPGPDPLAAAAAPRTKSTPAERAGTPVAGTGSPPLPEATDDDLIEEYEGRLSRNNLYQDPATRTEAEHLADELEARGFIDQAQALRKQIDDHLSGANDEDEDWDEFGVRAATAALEAATAALAKAEALREAKKELALTAAASPTARTWEGTLAPIGENSGDRRRFKPGGTFAFRPLPLPLMFQETTATGHDTATVVGRILTIEERDGEFWGTGDYLESEAFAVPVAKAIALAEANMGHVSVDLADVVAEVVGADGNPIPQDKLIELWQSGAEAQMFEQYAEATIIGATQVAKPAFAQAIITMTASPVGTATLGVEDVLGVDPAAGELLAGDRVTVSVNGSDGEAATTITGTVVVVDGEAGTVTVQPDDAEAETLTVPTAQVSKVGGAPTDTVLEAEVLAQAEAIVARAAEQLSSLSAAAGVQEEEWRPDPEVFANPQLTGITPMTIGKDGRVFGHIAAWGQCHVGFSKCVTPPDEASFDYFHIGEVDLADGTSLAVGNLTLGGRHADVKLAYRDAIAHYDDAGAGVAVVRAYKDEFGIAVAGILTPETTARQKGQLRRCGLSGDWRRIGTEMRLAGALAVNTGGFPVPRHAVDARGRQLGLVAAGMVPQSVEVEETYEQVARRVFAEESQKIERRAEIRAMAVTATTMANRDQLADLVTLIASADSRRGVLSGLLEEVTL